MAGEPGATLVPELVGIDVTRRAVDGVEHTVVQVLLDDDRPDFAPAFYDAPIVADVVHPDGSVVARELLDHDRFRRQLAAEREEGRSERRGVLLLDDGQVPEPWVRLAFLPVPLASDRGDHAAAAAHHGGRARRGDRACRGRRSDVIGGADQCADRGRAPAPAGRLRLRGTLTP